MKYLFALTLILLSFGCFAAVYMETDSQGNVIYSDTPSDKGKPVLLPETENHISTPQEPAKNQNTAQAPAANGGENTAMSAQVGHQNYTTFLITSPTDQQTFQNQPDLPVTIKIDPPLQTGDRVQLYIDGIPSGEPSSDLSQLVLHQVERGEHQLNAALLDAADHILSKTDNLTIFIHYSAIPTGSGAILPTSFGGNGITPSSPGSGVTPPSSNGSGITPPPTSPAQPGSGLVPPANLGGGLVPGRP